MKLIMAMIRIAKINKTKEALSAAGLPSFMASGKVQGRGRGRGLGPRYKEIMNNPELRADFQDAAGDGEPKLKTKRLVTLIVTNDKKDLAVQTIIKANQTGNSGDGKIFVTQVFDAVQIRTGDHGDEVLD
jgi:nitrogen regulatory protein PII 2